MDRTHDPELWHALAEVMSLTPDHYRRLLDLHVDAGCGRCRSCTQAGTGLPRTAWPCPMHRLASLARDLDRARSG
jgi:hypothetical protein